jgi:segregation and condensation protein B
MSEHEASVVTGEEAVSQEVREESVADSTATLGNGADGVVEIDLADSANGDVAGGAPNGDAPEVAPQDDTAPASADEPATEASDAPARRTRRPRRASTATTDGEAADAPEPAITIDLADESLPAAAMPFAQRVEAAILLADRPIADARLAEVLGLVPPSARGARDEDDDTQPNAGDSAAIAARRREAVRLVREAIDDLNRQYAETNRTFRIESVSGGRQMLTISAYGAIMARMKGARAQTRLSQAALETLAIVAYRQPILRAQLEAIRGVACGEVLKSLMERRLVKIVGRAEEVGRPMLYGTTPEFLRVFGLANLSDLPQAKDLR